MKKIICWLKRKHQWEFAYNFGIPLGCSWALWDKLVKEGKTFPVHRCKVCGVYDHPGDGLGIIQFGVNYDE